MLKFKDVAEYLKQDISTRDFNKGLELYRVHYGNNQYSKNLERKRNAKDLEWKLESVLRKNGLSLKDFSNAEPSGSQPAATGKPDAGQGGKPSESGEGGAVAPIELSDEVKTYIEAETEAWKATYKEAGGEHAIMVHIANSLESGDKSDKLADSVASLDAAFSEKLQKHWDNIEFAKANNAIPKESDEKKEAAIDVGALDNVGLLKKRSNARTAVSKYKKSGNEEKLAEHQALLDALDAEIIKRDLKA